MSRVGKQPIKLPEGVEVKAAGTVFTVKGKLGELSCEIPGDIADEVVYLPKASDIFAPIITVTPMQLFAYYMSVEKGCDVDKPRNLAKSVTVE